MTSYQWCDDCQCEIVGDCEHVRRMQKIARAKESQARWDEHKANLAKLEDIWNDLEALVKENIRLWNHPNEERDHDALRRASGRILELRRHIVARHTRPAYMPECDCDDCSYVRLYDDFRDPVASGIKYGTLQPDGSAHGPMCFCKLCMDERDRADQLWIDAPHFMVVDGMGATKVPHAEFEAFLKQYPNAREVQ